jgi:predicted amidophosphoribosyltransferase
VSPVWSLRARIAGPSLRHAVVVLVDDVLTTGETAEACSRVLRDAGADQIRVLTAARTVLRSPPASVPARR